MEGELKYVDAVKQSPAYKTIVNDILRGELSHAYLVITEDKDALESLFYLIACRVYCENACLECPSCHKVLSGSKPDVKMLALGDENFSVDDISTLVEDAGMTSFEGGAKLYFFKNFENVSEVAQNKLLKTLEEPFAGVHFFLGVATQQSVLSTILSRVKQVALPAFSTKNLYDGLIADGVSEEKAARGARLGQGSFTRARKLALDEDLMRHVSEVAAVLKGLTKSSEVYKYLKSPIFGKDRFKDSLDIMELIFSDVVNYRLGLDISLKEWQNDISALAEMYNERAIGEIFGLLLTCRKRIKANCITTGIADWLMLKITEVKHLCR